MEAEKKVQQRTIECRKKLLDAAYHLFIHKGYYNTNTKEIARQAGISIGNFYNYYQDKGEIYCVLLEDYAISSCQAMQELVNQLLILENRKACQEFLRLSLYQLLDRDANRNKFFEEAIVIAKENTKIQSIIAKTEDNLIAILELFLRKQYPNKQINFYIRARMLYIFTDQIAKDILVVDMKQQREVYIECFVDEIMHLAFDL